MDGVWLQHNEITLGQVCDPGRLRTILTTAEGDWSSAHAELDAECKTEFGQLMFLPYLAQVITEKAVAIAAKHAQAYFASTKRVTVDNYNKAKAAAVEAIDVTPGVEKADPKRQALLSALTHQSF